MKETYCLKDKRYTPCVEPSGYQKDKRGRTQFYCTCAVCGIKKVRYVKKNGQVGTGRKTKSGQEKKSLHRCWYCGSCFCTSCCAMDGKKGS